MTSAINKGVESNQGKIDACFIGFLKAFDSFWQAGLTLNCRVMELGGKSSGTIDAVHRSIERGIKINSVERAWGRQEELHPGVNPCTPTLQPAFASSTQGEQQDGARGLAALPYRIFRREYPWLGSQCCAWVSAWPPGIHGFENGAGVNALLAGGRGNVPKRSGDVPKRGRSQLNTSSASAHLGSGWGRGAGCGKGSWNPSPAV